jgi:integrase
VIDQAKSRTNDKTGKPLALTTIRGLKQTLRILKEYKTVKHRKIDFDTIDYEFYLDFKSHLEKELTFTANTVGKHIKHLKTVLNEASQEGLNTNHRYKSKRFKAISEPVNSIYLNESELSDLWNLDLSGNKRLASVRDLFLIGCWTGLRFSDFTRLNSANVQKEDGHPYFKIETQKTGAVVTIPIVPPIMPVLDQYGGIDGLSLPKGISNQKMNEYLKELAQKVESLNVTFDKERTKAGLKVSSQKMKWEFVSTHTARRSFASNMFQRKIPVSLIMAITGHKTEHEFYKYIQMKPNEQANMFRQMFNESSNHNVLKLA